METCFYCRAPLFNCRIERDHFPIPKAAGGAATVPACQPCHDLKDRIDWRDVPLEMKGEFMEDLDRMGRVGRIMFAKMLAAWHWADRHGAVRREQIPMPVPANDPATFA